MDLGLYILNGVGHSTALTKFTHFLQCNRMKVVINFEEVFEISIEQTQSS